MGFIYFLLLLFCLTPGNNLTSFLSLSLKCPSLFDNNEICLQLINQSICIFILAKITVNVFINFIFFCLLSYSVFILFLQRALLYGVAN